MGEADKRHIFLISLQWVSLLQWGRNLYPSSTLAKSSKLTSLLFPELKTDNLSIASNFFCGPAPFIGSSFFLKILLSFSPSLELKAHELKLVCGFKKSLQIEA